MNKGFNFSERTNWELGENPLSKALADLRASGVDIFDLTESNPTRCGFSYPPEIFLAPLAVPDSLIYAPQSQGMLAARQAVAAYYLQAQAVVDPQNLVLTSSTSEAYSFLFRLLFDPHDRVLIPAPSYPLLSYLAGLNDVHVDQYRLVWQGAQWHIDLASIEAAVTLTTRAIILVSPNNPTGSCVKKEELVRLNEICARRGLALICDEVFTDYLLDAREDICRTLAANQAALTFVLGGLSKALALPQMKLSWIAANGPEDLLRQSLARLEVIADTYLSVNTPAQNACRTWLPRAGVIRDQVLERVRGNLAYLKEAFAGAGRGEVLPVEGGWYAVIRVSLSESEDEWALRLLREAHTFVHPGFFFDFEQEGHVVISLLPQPERFREGIRRILTAL